MGVPNPDALRVANGTVSGVAENVRTLVGGFRAGANGAKLESVHCRGTLNATFEVQRVGLGTHLMKSGFINVASPETFLTFNGEKLEPFEAVQVYVTHTQVGGVGTFEATCNFEAL